MGRRPLRGMGSPRCTAWAVHHATARHTQKRDLARLCPPAAVVLSAWLPSSCTAQSGAGSWARAPGKQSRISQETRAPFALVARSIHGKAKTTVLNTRTQDKSVPLSSSPLHAQNVVSSATTERELQINKMKKKIPCSACGVCGMEQWNHFQAHKRRQRQD